MDKNELKEMPYRVTKMLLDGIVSVVEQAPDKRIEIEPESFYDERGNYVSSDIVAVYMDENGQCCVEKEDRWADDYLSELSPAELFTLIANM